MALSKSILAAVQRRRGPYRAGALYTEAQVAAGAGVTVGVTPGVLDRATGLTAGAYGTDYGLTSIGTDKGGFVPFNVTSLATFTSHGAYATNGTLVGSTYTISNCLFYAPASANSAFTWNHGANTTYNIKFKNCLFASPQANKHLFDILAPGTGTLTLEDCYVGGFTNLTATYAFVKVTAGTVNISRSFITRCAGHCFQTAGPTAVLTLTDSKFDTSDGTGNGWDGNFGSASLFYNSVAGGTMTCRRSTMDHKANLLLLEPYKNCSVTFDRVFWNSSASASPNGLICTNDTVCSEAWTSGLTMTDCRFYLGQTGSDFGIIGANNGIAAQSMNNWLISHCEFSAQTSGWWTNKSYLILGLSSTTSVEHTKNIAIEWCRFKKPTAIDGVAGNEVINFFRAANCTVTACWVNNCDEDAYEFIEPLQNCVVSYCGGGEVSGSYVRGNMVDFYGSGGVWSASDGNLGGHAIHHIWGSCAADAVIVDSVHNVAVHDIDVDNVTHGPRTSDEAPASNVRLHWRGNTEDALLGVRVTSPLSAVGISYAGKPCFLTYENSAASTYALSNPGTVSWWDGISATKGGADGSVDGM